MIPGLVLCVATLLLRGASTNRHVRARLMTSVIVAAVYTVLATALERGSLTAGMYQQIVTIQPLLLAFSIVNSLVALVINPWRVDRLPDRFPTIVQDAIVIALFGFAATLLLQEKIFAATAVGAVVLGLALQDTLGNLFAGLAIQIEKPFRVGHWVRIADIDGQVSEVTWRATKVRTKGGNFVIVPNSKLADDIIINYSEPNLETRIEVEVGVTYNAAPNMVKAVIQEAIKDEPLISKARTPEVLLVDFAASAITYRIRVWTTDFAGDERLRDRVRSAVYYAFRRNNIEIPYPIQVEYARHESTGPRVLEVGERAALRAVSIFSSLSDEEHDQLAAGATSGLYAAGEHIVRQGDAGASMFVVSRGEVAVLVDPGNQEIARIARGGFFGEMSLLTGTPRTATVKAVSDAELLEVTADTFRRLVLANPTAVEAIGAAVANRRIELEQRRSTGPATAAAEPPHKLIDRIRRFLGMTD